MRIAKIVIYLTLLILFLTSVMVHAPFAGAVDYDPPSGLKIKTVFNNPPTIQISWYDYNRNEVGYELQRRSEDSDNWITIKTLPPNTKETTDYIPEDGYYYYRVKVIPVDPDEVMNSDGSKRVLESDEVKWCAPPKRVTNFTATLSPQGNAIELQWEDRSKVEDNYIIIKSWYEGSETKSKEITLPANTQSYTDTDLLKLTTYRYRIKARNMAGDSDEVEVSCRSGDFEVAAVAQTQAGPVSVIPVANVPLKQQTVVEFTVGEPLMKINGQPKEIDPGRGTTPVIINSRAMVPMRSLVNALGGLVDWTPKTKTITITYQGRVYTLWVGKKNMLIRNVTELTSKKQQNIAAAPMIVNGRTMLPLTVIADIMGLEAKWDSTNQKIVLTTK